MKYFTAYKKVPVHSDGTLIDEGEPCGIVEYIVEEYEANGIVSNEVKYASLDENYILNKIKEEHPATDWENFDW